MPNMDALFNNLVGDLEVSDHDIIDQKAVGDEWAEETIRTYQADVKYWEPGLIPDDPYNPNELEKIQCICRECKK